jgi:hypothetical protein
VQAQLLAAVPSKPMVAVLVAVVQITVVVMVVLEPLSL